MTPPAAPETMSPSASTTTEVAAVSPEGMAVNDLRLIVPRSTRTCTPKTKTRAIGALCVLAAAGILYAATFTPLALEQLQRLQRHRPPPPAPPPSPAPLSFLIMTDWHNTPTYSNQYGHQCGCRSDLARPSCKRDQPASVFGQYRCDGPPELIKASLDAAVAVMPHPDVVFILGDLVTHNAGSLEVDRAVFQNTSALVADKFDGRSTRACQVPLGNNDVYPNYFTDTSAPQQYAFQAQVAREHCGLDEATAAVFARNGYYNVTLRGGAVKVLVLNTNALAYVNRPGGPKEPASVDETDPFGQFAWMDAQFADAEAHGMVVHIQAHIAPALDSFARSPAWQPRYAERYWELVGKWAHVLAGHFFGHWHTREVRAVADAPPGSALAKAPALQLLCALSPIYLNNPVFYTAELSPASLRVERFYSHTLDLASVGDYPAFVAEEMVYPPRGMSNEGWSELAESWHDSASSPTPGDDSFRAFFRQFKAGHSGTMQCNATTDTFQDCATCTLGCRTSFACLATYGRNASGYQHCMQVHGYPYGSA